METAARTPRLAGAFRAAASDFYYQSTRLVAANVVWGAALLAILALAIWVSPALGIVASPLLCVPLAGVARLAAQIVRGEDVVLSDAWSAMRRYAVPAFVAGCGLVAATAVFVTNAVSGVAAGSPFGLAFATLAGWGLLTTWTVAIAFWPILVDPAREAMTLSSRVRLAGLIVLAEPLRFAGLAVAVGLILALSALVVAALLTVSVAFVAVAAARVVLPAADALEDRVGRRTVGDPA